MPKRGTLLNEKSKDLLKFKPSFQIEQGYTKYIEWYKNFWRQQNFYEKLKTLTQKKKILIVGEIGNNHEGCFKTAKKLINMAAKAGVDAVKFQTYKTEKFILINDKKNFKKFKKFEFSFSQLEN